MCVYLCVCACVYLCMCERELYKGLHRHTVCFYLFLLCIITVNGLHLYSAFIQIAIEWMPLIHPSTHTFTHQRRLAAMQGTNQRVRSNWGLGVLLRDTSTRSGWDQTGNPPTTALTSWAISPYHHHLFLLARVYLFWVVCPIFQKFGTIGLPWIKPSATLTSISAILDFLKKKKKKKTIVQSSLNSLKSKQLVLWISRCILTFCVVGG